MKTKPSHITNLSLCSDKSTFNPLNLTQSHLESFCFFGGDHVGCLSFGEILSMNCWLEWSLVSLVGHSPSTSVSRSTYCGDALEGSIGAR